MAASPKLSVQVTVFNGERHLQAALDSLYHQTFHDFELIVVGDGSVDGTADLIAALDDFRIRSITHPGNRGIPAARNTALGAARGNFCALLSHDDIAYPHRLETQLAWLERHGDVGILGSAYDLVNDAGDKQRTVAMPLTDLEIRWMSLLECPLRQSSPMVRTELARATGYDERYPSYSDYDFIVRLLHKTRAANLPEALVGYRRHGANTSIRHRARLDEAGIDIACRAIRAELPDAAIARETVASLRRHFLQGKAGDDGASLDDYKAAINRFLDLREAFREKHHRHPELGNMDWSPTSVSNLR